jgi:hypothetical protein
MTIHTNDLIHKLAGKRIDSIDLVTMSTPEGFHSYQAAEVEDAMFALPRLRLVDPLGDVTYVILAPEILSAPNTIRYGSSIITASVRLIIWNENEEQPEL